jgi:predicted DCC family thiol-disulfide oxidoreductase YuxK
MTGEFPDDSQSSILLLYDGVCALCNRLVTFLLRHDRCDRFRFAPLQSELAGSVLRRYGLSTQNFDGVVVLANFRRADERMLMRSEAVLWSIGQLNRTWKLLAIARLIPLSVREAMYRFIARRRYRLFGRYASCPVPRAEHHHKFLGG